MIRKSQTKRTGVIIGIIIKYEFILQLDNLDTLFKETM